jgi:uncharacterized integral membrane protein
MLRVIILLPFLIVLIAFVLSNQQPVPLSLWPTDLVIQAPLSLAVVLIAFVFFFLGALIVWLPSLHHRRRAAKAERRVSALEAQLATQNKGLKLLPAPAAR